MTALDVPAAVLAEAGAFFETCGSTGREGTALLVAVADEVTRLVIPDQVASTAPGCSVEVTRAGKLAVAASLGATERVAARIHSHPLLAFHSETDDANPAITQEGAISIVVPFFGLGLRRGLAACAVLVRRGGRWIDLPAGPDRDQVVRTVEA